MPEDFFIEKRPWSRVKDGILEYYMDAYLRKMAARRPPLLLVDTFAGPGKFDNGDNGSPLIICKAAERLVRGKYTAVFTNIDKTHHQELKRNLENFSNAHAHLMTAGRLLRHLNERIRNQDLFLYLDPYGIEGCDYELVKPLLDRTLHGDHSTELLLVFQMPYLHRQAARESVLQRREEIGSIGDAYDIEIAHLSPEFQAKVRNVDRIMGGTYWQPIEYGPYQSEEREHLLMQAYTEHLGAPDKLSMFCSVESDFQGETKYYICFVSRSMDAAIFMNEAMYNSRNSFYSLRAQQIVDSRMPLFAGDVSPWDLRKQRDTRELISLIPDYVSSYAGRSRQQIWTEIIMNHFMRFSQRDYRSFVADLVRSDKIDAVRDGKKVVANRINDETLLYPK
jgi:three-Cys-motif partner protein